MRKAIAAHMRSRGFRVTPGPGGHFKTGRYASAALDHLGIADHLAEFDVLRDIRNQSEYDALWVRVEDIERAVTHVRAIVDAVESDLR